jgi:hypothetical protein
MYARAALCKAPALPVSHSADHAPPLLADPEMLSASATAASGVITTAGPASGVGVEGGGGGGAAAAAAAAAGRPAPLASEDSLRALRQQMAIDRATMVSLQVPTASRCFFFFFNRCVRNHAAALL